MILIAERPLVTTEFFFVFYDLARYYIIILLYACFSQFLCVHLLSCYYVAKFCHYVNVKVY